MELKWDLNPMVCHILKGTRMAQFTLQLIGYKQLFILIILIVYIPIIILIISFFFLNCYLDASY